jgi:hypothetical protein
VRIFVDRGTPPYAKASGGRPRHDMGFSVSDDLDEAARTAKPGRATMRRAMISPVNAAIQYVRAIPIYSADGSGFGMKPNTI